MCNDDISHAVALCCPAYISAVSVLEVCMGMGIPWDSHGNGSSFGLLIGMGMGMGIVLMGMGMSYFIGEK